MPPIPSPRLKLDLFEEEEANGKLTLIGLLRRSIDLGRLSPGPVGMNLFLFTFIILPPVS